MVATQGLVTRSGIVPRGPTQDRAGPMCRDVYDVAATLSVIAGWDAEDGDTLNGMGHFPNGDWSKLLGRPDLTGKRIGVLREMFNTGRYDEEVKAVFDRSLDDMRKAGAIIIDPMLTGLDLRTASSNQVIGTSHPRLGDKSLPYELVPATNAYLARLGPSRPWKTLQDMVVKVGPEKVSEEYYNSLNFLAPDRMPDYLSRLELRAAVSGRISETLQSMRLDAAVLPYQSVPPPPWDTATDQYTAADRANNLTSATGLPGVIVPGGYTKDNLPVALQFVGRPWEDLKLLQVAYGYEQSSKRRKTPQTTPPLPGEKFTY
jgi:Asp-tRNA(Asn)/Glu-tRNA(Gln) amidotransferase A subunit family amidase